MAKLSITQASKAAQISRQTMYRKYINTGKISVELINEQKYIDTSELIRVFGVLHLDGDMHPQPEAIKSDSPDNSKDQIIDLLKEQLEHERQEKKWLMEQLEKTTHLLEDKTVKKRKKFLGIF
jgi:hypothetical protein